MANRLRYSIPKLKVGFVFGKGIFSSLFFLLSTGNVGNPWATLGINLSTLFNAFKHPGLSKKWNNGQPGCMPTYELLLFKLSHKV